MDMNEPGGLAALVREVLHSRIRTYARLYGSIQASQPAVGRVMLDREHREDWDFFLKSDKEFERELGRGVLLAPAGRGPLLTSKWKQGNPFNLFCPMGDGGRTIVGCVATAAAQIMRYHRFPPRGRGKKTYYWDGDNSCDPGKSVGKGYLTADFSDEYDWGQMPDKCGKCNGDQTAAISELSYEVGVAFSMDYGKCGSGAYTGYATTVYPTWFWYKSSIQKRDRDNYNATQWFNMIKNEIDNNRPMQYRIYAHSIVCDGWRVSKGKNQYHMNYGWGGSRNAWYTIDKLHCPWKGCDPMAEYMIRYIEPGCCDTMPPDISCPPNKVLNANSYCRAYYSGPRATATDECDANPSIMSSPRVPVWLRGLGDHTITWIAKDREGYADTCYQTITVVDVTPPQIKCPPTKTLVTDRKCEAVYTGPSATAWDNCDGSPAITSSPALPAKFTGLGDHTITWTATDASGNVDICYQTVKLIDTTPPIITCPPGVTLEGDENCEVVYSGPPATAVDNCDANPVITSVPALPATFSGVGDHYIEYTATDGSGNSSKCTQTVTLIDVTPPEITCPPDIVMEADENCQVVYRGPAATATDNCDVRPTITSVPALPATFTGVGDHFITYTATDQSGNSSECTQMVTVIDVTPPEITCPPDVAIEPVDFACEITYSGPPATATDNCDVSPVITSDPPLPVTYGGIGEYEIVFTATDFSMNSSKCTMTVTLLPTSFCLKQEAIDSLEALMPTHNGALDKEIKDAISHIEKSLYMDLWVGVKHVGCKHGHQVFNEEKTAIVKLTKEMRKFKFARELADEFEIAVNMLLDADEILAKTKLGDAIYLGGEQKHIDKAEKELDKAIGDRDLDRFEHALDHYRKAWDQACKALAKPSGGGIQVGLGSEAPAAFALGQNVPNPFSGRTVIHYEIPHDVHASVRIYDLAGQLVRSLAEGDHEAGLYVVEWDGTDRAGVEVPPGIYFNRLYGGGLTLSRKMVILR
jgi:hypothetical protein